MDYNKIGNFIANERKAKKLTQAKLAEKLFVSEKTISKWENGNGIPDTNILPKLCEIFNVSINELLNGERILNENYINKAEEKLFELQIEKSESDKRLLGIEILLAAIALMFLCSVILIFAFVKMPLWLSILLIIFCSIVFLASVLFCLRIEQKTGFYVCKRCGYKYIPTYNQVLWAPHINRTRYMKCPQCKQKSWQKKVIK